MSLTETKSYPTARVLLLVLMIGSVAESAAAQGITLMWDANPEPDVAGYIVYVGTQPGAYSQSFDAGNTTSFAFPHAAAGQQYCFAVSAYASGLESTKSNAVCGYSNAPPVLAAPGNQTSAVGQQVSLQLVGSDPYGDPLTYSATGLPPGLSLTPSTGFISGSGTAAGTFHVTATVSDGVLTASRAFTWTLVTALPPSAILLSPSGAISTTTPTFVWQAVTGATSYRLWVDDASPVDPRLQKDYTPAQAGCGNGSGTCQVSPGVTLASGPASWSVRASSTTGDGPWSGALDFSIRDLVAPTVTITLPTTGASFSTTHSTMAVGGTAADDVGVTQVSWSNDRGGSGTANGTTTWSIPSVPLHSGANVITVTARDAAGNTALSAITITRSTQQALTIAIASPTTASTHSTAEATVSLSGTAAGAQPITQVTWSTDRGRSGTASGTSAWSAASIPLDPGVNVITVTARDSAGNTASDALIATYTAPATVVSESPAPPPAPTATERPLADGTRTAAPRSTTVPTAPAVTTSTDTSAPRTAPRAPRPDSAPVGIAATTMPGTQAPGSGALQGGLASPRPSRTLQTDGHVPLEPDDHWWPDVDDVDAYTEVDDPVQVTVTVMTPPSGQVYVTNVDTITVSGSASDEVVELTWTSDAGGKGVANGTTVWQIPEVALQPGLNVIVITASDSEGRTSNRLVTIRYDPQ